MIGVLLALSLAAQTPAANPALDLAGPDKLVHFAAALVVTDAAWATAAALDAPLWARIVAGASAGAVAGVAKELADLMGCGTASFGDLAYDALGIGAGVGAALAVEAVVLRAAARAPEGTP